jgi:hypothetical protein
MPKPSPYLSYLLRLWLAGDGDQPQWRASLDDSFNGERVGFASPQELFAFLQAKIQFNPAEQHAPKEDRIP